MFENPKKEFMEHIHQEIGDYQGNYSQRIIYFQGKHWIVMGNTSNPEEKNLSLLAYLLGAGWLNIPEIRLLSQDEFQSLSRQIGSLEEGACSDNTYLTRLVQDYARNELAIHDLDRAMASEIVFSCWVHRRDACFGNRAFASDIPMFFDFNIAFGADHGDFFRSGPDAGYARNWGFWRIEKKEVLGNLVLLRHLEWEKSFAAIPIIDKDRFETSLRRYIKHIRSFKRHEIYNLAKETGFSEEKSELLTDFLFRSSEELKISVGKIYSILNKNNFDLLYIDNSRYRPVNRSDYGKVNHYALHPPYLSQQVGQEVLRLQTLIGCNHKTEQFFDIARAVKQNIILNKIKIRYSFIEKLFPKGNVLSKE